MLSLISSAIGKEWEVTGQFHVLKGIVAFLVWPITPVNFVGIFCYWN
jgi:nitrate reductase NapE component